LNVNGNNITNIQQLITEDGSTIRVGADAPFTGFDQAITITLNQSLGEGVVSHGILDRLGAKIMRLYQSGKNNSAGYMGDSQIIGPNNLSTNGSVVTNCINVMSLLGIIPQIFCDTTGTGADLLVQDDIQLGGTVFAGAGIRATELANFVMRGNDLTVSNGTVHIAEAEINFTTGFTAGDPIVVFSEGFTGGLGNFYNLQSDTGNWVGTSSGNCNSGSCAFATSAGSGNVIMEANLSTLDVDSLSLSFVYTVLKDSGPTFNLTADNNEGNSELVFSVSPSSDVTLVSFDNILSSDMANRTRVTLRFTCDADPAKPEDQCYIDDLLVNGTAQITTIMQQTGFDGQICFNDASKTDGICNDGVFYNATGDAIQFPGLQAPYVNGEAHVCVRDNGQLFASETTCA